MPGMFAAIFLAKKMGEGLGTGYLLQQKMPKTKIKGKYNTLRLILGDQLNLQHSWYTDTDPGILYVLMEVRSETDYVWHHIQKACAFFAAMERFADALRALGHQVVYIRLDHHLNRQGVFLNCQWLLEDTCAEKFEYQLPDEYRLDQELLKFCAGLQIPYQVYDSEHFFTTREALGTFFRDKKVVLMETFYREMRSSNHILMDGDDPVGGKWNFDSENREKLPRGHEPVLAFLFSNDVSRQYSRILNAGVKTIGKIRQTDFFWPLDRAQSLELLAYFTRSCLQLFGTFQDAMHSHAWSIYHSRLSFAMNTKMISPAEVIDAAIKAWQEDKKGIAINQLEGFVRQILGWREYMRGIYWFKMPGFAHLNYFGHQRKLPDWYWTGDTKMNCLASCIRQSLDYAYAHHIQRLMVTGNFALLAGIEPDQVDFWYLSIYIDAIEWVEITNTRGMSQYADGGITGSKPYSSTANYINKMSNYCERCHYSKTENTGERSCPFNSLYWDFHDRNRPKLLHERRLSMVYRIWDNMDAQKREAILVRAEQCLNQLDEL